MESEKKYYLNRAEKTKKISNNYIKFNSQIIPSNNNGINMKEKMKLFEYRKTEKLNINKQSKNEYSLKYDTNYILNRRKSFQIPRTSLNNKIKYKKLELDSPIKKKVNINNLTNYNITSDFILSRLSNRKIKKNELASEAKKKTNQKNKSESKNYQNKTMTSNDIKQFLRNKNLNLRKTNIPHKRNKKNDNLSKNTEENLIKNEIKNNNKSNTSQTNFKKKKILHDEKINNNTNNNSNKNSKKEKKAPICKINSNEHELDKFFRQNDNYNNNNKKEKNDSNNELFRFSNISKINNNDLSYLNNKNNIYDKYIVNNEKRNSIFINPKIEKIEGNESHELFDLDDKKLLEDIISNRDKNLLENAIEPIVSIPCLNCDKLINIDEMDEHSNKCFNIKEEKILEKKNNYSIIIDNKLRNILEYFVNLEKNKNINLSGIEINFDHNLIQIMKSNLENILNIKETNENSIEKLSSIKENINNLMEKYVNSNNIFALLSRSKILLEEKIKIFDENIKKIKKNLENSVDETVSESETAELFDLKKMEKILDEKELKTENIDKFVNEAKNKRLFLMEVLKVKFQKISENKSEDLIPPIMIWEEACKQNIEMKNWTKFIFNELHNPNKYIKMIQKSKK